jgi:DNA-3-methyladenine glycosylase
MIKNRLSKDFFLRDALEVAPELLGKHLVIKTENTIRKFSIYETEAYKGTGDLACHASRGRTKRTEVMFREGGVLYMYLIYGMHWMLNVVTAPADIPQAVLIRGLEGIDGPGKLTRQLGLDGSFYGESLVNSERIWIEDNKEKSILSDHSTHQYRLCRRLLEKCTLALYYFLKSFKEIISFNTICNP